jgi:anthranilate phosphoribosyltransferase
MDEISITGPSLMWEIKNRELVASRRISPADFCFNQAIEDDIRGGTPEENAETLKIILSGAKGAKRDVVVLNAAAALLAGEKVRDFDQGAAFAQETIDSGKALNKLKKLIDYTQEITGG